MKFNWQQSRGEALYTEESTKQVFGIISFENENRLKIQANYCGPDRSHKLDQTEKRLGIWSSEQAAKQAVETYTEALFPAVKED